MIRVFLVGPGRLGCSIAVALTERSDYELTGIAYHSDAGAARARRWAPGIPVTSIDDLGVAGTADVVLLTVRDDAIAEAGRRIASSVSSDAVVLHASGLLDSRVFEGAGIAAECGSMHPLQTFVDPAMGAERMRGAFVAVEGSARARDAARDLAVALGARVVTLVPGGKAAYHAAAVVASNYLVVLTSLAAELCDIAGIDTETAIEMLGPLQTGALANLSEQGLPSALTGPIARGDADTIRAHRAVLESFPVEARSAYSHLGELACALAERQGLSADAVASVRAALRDQE